MRSIALVVVLASSCVAGCSHQLAAPPSGPYGTSIQAASTSGFSGDRAATLKRLANSPLNQAEQCYLVDAVDASNMFSDDRCVVLIALIKSPNTTSATLTYLPTKLNDMCLFSDDRRRVLDAVITAQQERGAQATAQTSSQTQGQ